MIAHVLGWVTLASQLGLGVWVGRYLWDTGSRPMTWQRRLVVPKAVVLHLSPGSDYAGYV